MEIYFIDNIDLVGIDWVFYKLSDCFKSILVIVIFKFGGILEFCNGMIEVKVVFVF